MTNYFTPILINIYGHDCATTNSSIIAEEFESSVNHTLDFHGSSLEWLESSKDTNFSLALNSSILLEGSSMNHTMDWSTLDWSCNPYIGQLIYANLYGITSAAYVLLTTLVLADLLGADKFTNAFGLLLLFQGVASFIGPPIVGFMFDAYGSYNKGLVLMGVMIALS